MSSQFASAEHSAIHTTKDLLTEEARLRLNNKTQYVSANMAQLVATSQKNHSHGDLFTRLLAGALTRGEKRRIRDLATKDGLL
ncbi:MAG: hypothetical protein WC753_04220 [Candidatus Gracilibacteria bacterium]|jgi:hypothetical protein